MTRTDSVFLPRAGALPVSDWARRIAGGPWDHRETSKPQAKLNAAASSSRLQPGYRSSASTFPSPFEAGAARATPRRRISRPARAQATRGIIGTGLRRAVQLHHRLRLS